MQISKIIEEGKHLVQATQKSKPSESGERLLKAVQNKKIFEESDENLDNMFRYCMLLVGLREKNFPNNLETEMLHAFLKDQYGGHTIEEIKLAFDMAVRNKLDLEFKDVKCYENFSVLYLSSIINSYRRWASQEYSQVEQFLPPDEKIKRLEAPKQEIDWGYLIEKAYQHFLSFGEEHYRLWPVGFYEQLVKDQVIDSELFRSKMIDVRKICIGELIREKNILMAQASLIGQDLTNEKREDIKSRLEFAKSMNDTKIQDNDKITSEYNSGERDTSLVVVAKQYCVLQYFKNSKDKGRKNVYQPVND